MISIVTCCHGAKLCAHVAQDFDRNSGYFPSNLIAGVMNKYVYNIAGICSKCVTVYVIIFYH